MLSFCISSIASNSGKTILSTALLYHFRNKVRPFKIGPDFIDPLFHKKVCNTNSVNLDTFIMNKQQTKWTYNNYSDKKVSILEGVMGFYDGQNKGCSTYSITKLLQIPTILILDGSGSYITISAVLQGVLKYKKDNTIKAVILNKLSSKAHFELIKNQIKKDHKNIIILGWIEKNLPTLNTTHLGLDLDDLDKIKKISCEVLKHIDIKKLKKLSFCKKKRNKTYPFEKIDKINKNLTIVNDENFSFLYYDNLQFLKEIFKKVTIINSTKDEKIPKNSDMVYICGGYIETKNAYEKIKNSNNFKNSLIKHSKNKKIYGECAGALYLGKNVDDKTMSGILDIGFALQKKFVRLGYYYNSDNLKGHCFHYTKPISNKKGYDILSKKKGGIGLNGSWESRNKNILITFFHTMFRNNTSLILKRFT
jgi:cobyrinic acid a,c-diamide synthase